MLSIKLKSIVIHNIFYSGKISRLLKIGNFDDYYSSQYSLQTFPNKDLVRIKADCNLPLLTSENPSTTQLQNQSARKLEEQTSG